MWIQCELIIHHGEYRVVQSCTVLFKILQSNEENNICNNRNNGVEIKSYFSDWLHQSYNNTSIASPTIKFNLIHNNGNHGVACITFADGARNDMVGFIDSGIRVKTTPVLHQNTIYGNNANGIFLDCTIIEYFHPNCEIETNPFIDSNIIPSIAWTTGTTET